MIRLLDLLWTSLKLRISRDLIYGMQFWVAFCTDFILFFIQVLVFYTIFSHVTDINGWGKYQFSFFIGTFMILDTLKMVFYFFGTISFPNYIRTGELDVYLTKPINPLFLIAIQKINLGGVLNLVPGFLIVIYSAIELKVQFTLGTILGYFFFLTLFSFLLYFLMLAPRLLAFWFVKLDFLMELDHQLNDLAFKVPGVVYQGVSKIIFYILLPFGLVATIPTQFATSVLEGKYWLLSIAVVVSYALLIMIMWKRGIKQYSSASS